jgi:hypothetical protein
MPCPDRNNDERILREIERRKKMQNNEIFEQMIFEGELQLIQFLPEFERVKRIEKLDELTWELTLKTEQE